MSPSPTLSSTLRAALGPGGGAGLAAPGIVLLMLVMMVVPIPAFGLDVLFTFNIALSLVVLLVSIYASRPLDFSSFPTVLLAATLMRLSLNVASTRVVLLEGHTGTASAGQVIESFADFVIGGNYAVGLVVFAILVIINFVVVTKGAGRVSEVGARFILDAMPGKQMAIDADLNAGLLDRETARERRAEVAAEADFYGSMDGASKFVKGDAIAGLLVLAINLVGGLAIGMGQHGLGFGDAARLYSLLTIGDGLVAQLPSLLLSMATAVIVTRVSAAGDMGSQIGVQLFDDPRALGITAALLFALGLVPGMPNVVFLGLGAALGFAAWKIASRPPAPTEAAVEEPAAKPGSAELDWDDVEQVDPIALEVGYALVPLVAKERGGTLPDRVRAVRRKLTGELGFLVPRVHMKDDPTLAPNVYRVRLSGSIEGEAELFADRHLAIGTGLVGGALAGVRTVDPTFGMEATWIEDSLVEEARARGYTVVDPATVVATHLGRLVERHAGSLLGHEEVQQLLDALAKGAPRLVEDLTPKTLALPVIVRVLQNLLDEGVPIVDLKTIAGTLAERGGQTQDPVELTAQVRVALRRFITGRLTGFADTLPVITLDPALEKLCVAALERERGGGVGIEPGLAERLYASLAESVERQDADGEPAVLLVDPAIRPWLAGLMRHTIPLLHVLAWNEISESKRLRVVASIGGDPNQPAAAAAALEGAPAR